MNANESAFPSIEEIRLGRTRDDDFAGVVTSVGGLTKREYFAGLAMQALVGNNAAMAQAQREGNPDKMAAKVALIMADALIAELEKSK